MKVTWYKMSEKPPQDGDWVWVCIKNEVNKFPINWGLSLLDYNICQWAYADKIEVPEPPDLAEEEKHLCEWQTLGTIFTCKESALKGCWFNLYIHLENRFDCITRVQFCPNCGKEAK